jgi:hypothetical protein
MSYNVSDWMWIVGDTNPTTQVYSSAAGGMIANNSAAFLTWHSGRAAAIAIGDHDGYAIGGATDNGSGLIRLIVTTTARMQNNQRWAVAGSGSANVDGNWPITVVNATQIDLQGSNSAYAGAVTGGYVLGATFIDTMANLTSVLNRAAFTRFQEATKSFTSAVDLALDNPLAATSLINITAAGKSVTLPAMNAVNSVPVGIPFVMVNTGAFTFTLKDKAGTALGELAPQASWQLTNTTNATIAGAFQTIVTLYNSGTGGILQTAPKTDTAAAQGDWTHIAHQSNPGQFDGRNNEVWGFGYNLSNAWSSRNGLDDGIGMGWETHYYHLCKQQSRSDRELLGGFGPRLCRRHGERHAFCNSVCKCADHRHQDLGRERPKRHRSRLCDFPQRDRNNRRLCRHHADGSHLVYYLLGLDDGSYIVEGVPAVDRRLQRRRHVPPRSNQLRTDSRRVGLQYAVPACGGVGELYSGGRSRSC